MPGIIEPKTLRTEQYEFKARTTDPTNTEPGEYWVRVDQTSSNPQVVAELRRQDTSGVSKIPLFAGSEEANLGSQMVRGPPVVLDDGTVGFIAQTTDSKAAYGSPRVVTASGAEYLSHNALTLPAIPDSVTSRPDDDSTVIDASYKSGVGIVTSSEWPSIAARISANSSGVSTAYLLDSNNNEIQSVDISGLSAGDTFSFSNVGLQSGETYAIAIDNDGSSHDVGFVDEANYPYTGPDLDITEGYVNGYDGTGQQPRSVNDIGNPDGVL